LLCWREASANRSNFRALRGVIMAKDGARVLDQQGTGWVLRGSLIREKNALNDDVKVRWSFMNDNIKAISADGIDLDGFLYHYWISHGNFTQKKDIFKTIKENIKNKVAAKKLLDELQTYSEVYKDLHEPSLRKWRNDEMEIKIALEAINRFRVKHPIPLMMIALKKYDTKTLSKSELLNIFQTIETFTFINTNLMNARSSGGVAQMYAFHAKALASATETTRKRKAIEEFVKKLSLKIPSQEIFQEKFRALRYSDKFPLQKKEIQYVVTRLFSAMFPAVAINTNEMSIEHIEPQSSKKLEEATLASIGNLWFLKTEFNNALGNIEAAVKLQKYRDGQLPCDKILAGANTWTKKEVDARTEELGLNFWGMVQRRFQIPS
ncbi:HNH endonuclease family protein, partial [Acidovorax sp. SUPP1855]|uniref:HNH endonuclease family protein n=1 Tax=Acidovorax sp. SUPP1855 TaxID=431774 RepID=UPI0024E099F3